MAKEDTQTKSKTKIIMTIGGIVIAALVVAVVVLLVRGQGGEEEEEKRNVLVTEDNAEEVAESLVEEEYVAPGYYNANMSTTWHFATGDAVSEDAYVKNDEGNTNDVYFDVFLADDEGSPILESPILPRGAELEDISLDRPLAAGSYDCVMVYHLVDEDQNSIATLRVTLTIVVEN